MHELQAELERRWRAMFAALASGDDVPPAQRLRTEGMMEAAVLVGAASREELSVTMDRCYREQNEHGFEEVYGADWQDFFLFPQIPAMGKRAPVYPSTKE